MDGIHEFEHVVDVLGGDGCAVVLDIEEPVGRGGVEDLLCNFSRWLGDINDWYAVSRDFGCVHVGHRLNQVLEKG